MSHVIHTVQMNNVRVAVMADIPTVDITVKTGLVAFAPTWDMVWGSKSGAVSPEAYQDQYLRMMQDSRTRYPEAWQSLLAMPVVALVCYCRPGIFCHRHVLKDELLRLHHQAGEEALDGGELLP